MFIFIPMALTNNIILRPRFQIELTQNNEEILKIFEETKTSQKSLLFHVLMTMYL